MAAWRVFSPFALGVVCLLSWSVMSQPQDPESLRQQSRRLLSDGQFREALAGFEKLCRLADNPQIVKDLESAVECLNRLGQPDKLDELLESTIAIHRGNWRLLHAAAAIYGKIPHHGYVIAGEFRRGGHRGGGQAANAEARDRVRAIQLLVEAMQKAPIDDPSKEVGQLYLLLADTLVAPAMAGEPWRLLALTDLSQLPDYELGWSWRGARWGHFPAGAPVDEQGQPVFHTTPNSWDEAHSDGQRWRWALEQAQRVDPSLKNTVRLRLADFCESQFGVQTLAPVIIYTRQADATEGAPEKSGTYALHTLAEHETIARLANGVRRFTLPDEFNPIKILQTIAAEPQTGHADTALERLAAIFENRRQYPRAAEYWREVIKRFGADKNRSERLQQITGNWCRFETARTQPAGQGAVVDLVFRNGKKISFEARRLRMDRWLADLKAYLRSNPRQLHWERVNLQAIGWLLLTENGQKYIGEKVAEWDLELTPAENHFDRRVTVTTPLQKAGAYLVTGRMAEGNEVRMVLWVADTALVHKPLAQATMYYVADARTGSPVAGANVEFFGYRLDFQRNTPLVFTKNFAEKSDHEGLVILDTKQLDPDYQWLTVATTADGRLAFLGFSGAWIAEQYDPVYDAIKVFGMSDRPVYRPGQRVEFKIWVARARYDYHQKSEFARRVMKVKLINPRGEEIWKDTLQADDYGGINGTYEIPSDATLGVYWLYADHGSGDQVALQFRVEEYKKPEFEVTVEAPDKPVMLGEKITATIRANYYFGAPVTQGTVKYKVLRYPHEAVWFPVRPWDWCYGPGYWWFADDYEWYPGWSDWVGCRRPKVWWWPRPSPPPEVVAEAELPIGSDGTVPVEIDTTWVKENFGDSDHRYTITAEVRDPSRRTIVGNGSVYVARRPFKVFVWLDRGYYRVGDTITAHAQARTVDGRPVTAKGTATLYQISYTAERNPIETPVTQWPVQTDESGHAEWKLQASQKGQYRLAVELTDTEGHTVHGGYVFVIIGEGFDGREFRFNSLELVPDRAEYAPGQTVHLQLNTDHPQATVLLFVRPTNGVYSKPQVLRLQGKSTVIDLKVAARDMPNFFVEAVTVFGGRHHVQVREIIVPPEQRVLNVKAVTDQVEYRPGQKAKLKIQLTDLTGEAVAGSVVATVYDKAVEYISGGSNVADIREFFWKWRREHHPQHQANLDVSTGPFYKPAEPIMRPIGVFGAGVADELGQSLRAVRGFRRQADGAEADAFFGARAAMAEAEPGLAGAETQDAARNGLAETAAAQTEEQLAPPQLRTDFADTALWVGRLETAGDGTAELDVPFPDNVTTWKIRVWSMAAGTRVGSAETEVVTRKNIILRMQTPRFAIQGDEMTLSANVHNELTEQKNVAVSVNLSGDVLELLDPPQTTVAVASKSQVRVDWRVRVRQEGTATVRMQALTDVESDAVEMSFPCYVHGILKTESWAGTVRPDQQKAAVSFRVPDARRVEQSLLEVRYSPSLALAMVDALPYLIDYPYGCTEQTLNRFLPAVLTQKVLINLGLNLEQIRAHRTNLNAQEIGDPQKRRQQWRRLEREPVFDKAELERIVRSSVERLTNMQNADGGWGWFSGWAETSHPHTTAQVVRGLLVAQANDVPLVPDVLQSGIEWLRRYEEKQVQYIRNADGKIDPWKPHADNVDAFVRHVLAEAGIANAAMRDFLYRDRNELSLYGKALFALSLYKENAREMLDMLMRNLAQFLVVDEENDTAYLRFPNEGYWWMWYGDEIETQAAYLKLLSRTEPRGVTAPRLVKYLLNNRKHATYWRSTRDTALCVEAFAEYLLASRETSPDMVIEVWLDGVKRKEVAVNADNLFYFDNMLTLSGNDVSSGEHVLELRRRGTGPVYFNVYSSNFTLEDPIRAAGLEVKVQRKYYRLVPEDRRTEVPGQRGQPVAQRTEKFRRIPLNAGDSLASGELIEVELEIASKNDYEYLMFEDLKPAGCEPLEVRSGYVASGLPAYVEFRDDRVTLFLRHLARGDHSVSYRLRAEIPGRFSALPTLARGMYAPELRANSDEQKLQIIDKP